MNVATCCEVKTLAFVGVYPLFVTLMKSTRLPYFKISTLCSIFNIFLIIEYTDQRVDGTCLSDNILKISKEDVFMEIRAVLLSMPI